MMQNPQDAPPPRAEYARTWRRYLRFFGPRAVEDLDDELRFHIEMRVRDYMAQGMSDDEARAATARRFGDFASARQTCATISSRRERRMTRAQLFDALVQDVRFAGRTLKRQKAWTAIAVLTLALGIGANSAMFSVVNHLLLNPIPYPNADRIVVVFQEPSQGNSTGMSVMITPIGRLVNAWATHATRAFEAIEPYKATDVTLEPRTGSPSVAHAASIRPTFAKFADQRPMLGRMFTNAEARAGDNVVLISEGMWHRQYGADPNVIGQTLTIDSKVMTIIGVMPGVFQLPRAFEGDVDLWLPLDLVRSDDDGMLVVGRIRRGVSHAQAAAELDAITARDPKTAKYMRFKAHLSSPDEMVSFKDSLLLLSVAVALVLLIACANVAHLLLARASTRQREMAIRTALGAGTTRLFRQLLTESLILSLVGFVGGMVIGWAGLRMLIKLRPESLSDLAAARIDGTTFLVTALLSVATGIIFGVIGAVQASRHSTHDALKTGAPGASADPSRGRVRAILVVSEMALCTMLLIGAALLLRSVVHLQTRDPGFNTKGLYSLEISLPQDRYKTPASRAGFYDQLSSRIRALPGFVGAASASTSPPGSSFLVSALQVEGEPDPEAGATSFLSFNGVEPNYFRLLGIRFIEGGTFTDTTEKAAQVIVNEGMARKYWPGQSAIGKRLRTVQDGQGEWRTIVGVVANAFTGGLTQEASRPMIYGPPSFFRNAIVVRTTGDARVMTSMNTLVASMDKHLPPPRITSVEDAMLKSIARPRFTMFLLMVFTLVAVALAGIGLYGVLAYTVAQRTREIGIRMALGASRRDVARSVMSRGVVLAGIGAVIGIAAARAGTKLIGSMLYGVGQSDPLAFSAGVALLVVIALLACVVPTRRAVSVDPLIAMRAD